MLGPLQEAEAEGEGPGHAPSLRDLCVQSLKRSVSADTVCAGLQAVSALEPALDSLAAPLLACLAAHLPAVAAARAEEFAALPLAMLLKLLSSPSLVTGILCCTRCRLLALTCPGSRCR